MTGGNSDPEDWKPIIGTKAHKEELARKFKDNDDPMKIAIVVDMWLTGFDVPSLASMYVYKPMHGYILKQIKPRLTPHFFRHNYVTLLYESGVDPLIAMKIVGHTDYQTTANIYTHVRDEMLKKATVNMNEVFQKRTEE